MRPPCITRPVECGPVPTGPHFTLPPMPCKRAAAGAILGWGMAALFLSALPALSAVDEAMLRYARTVERELAGDASGALAGYRDLLQEVAVSNPLLAEKILYRVGSCERHSGRLEAARTSWRRLVEDYPARDAMVVRAREELKALEQELDRVAVEGSVHIEKGPVPAYILAGEWGNEPVVVAESNGEFRVERKMVGRDAAGQRTCLVYAEHPELSLVAAGVFSESGKVVSVTGLQLRPAVALAGRVVDVQGRAVSGAAIQVIGYQRGIPLPFDRILPPVMSASGGDFVVSGLAPGLRYVVTAVKSNCRMVTAVEQDTTLPSRVEGAVIACGNIVVRRLGEITLRGRVVDESGGAARVTVTAWSLPPVEREVARVTSDREGRFVFRDLIENGVALKAEGEGYQPRTVTGIRPMGQDIDMVVKGDGLSVPGRQSGSAASSLPPPAGTEPDEAPPSPARVPAGPFPLESLHWLRGNADSGSPMDGQDLRMHVVVWHFGSPYVEAALRARYPGEPGILSQVMRVYGDAGVICVWVLLEDEDQSESARIALDLYPGLPVASLARSDMQAFLAGKSGGQAAPAPVLEAGNLVMGRGGRVGMVCTDQQLFKAVKMAVWSR